MGAFSLLVAIPKDRDSDDVSTAVEVDRIVRPFMRDRGYGRHDDNQPILWYAIDRELAPGDDGQAYAYIDLGGCWRTQFLPDKIADDGELGDHTPLDEWRGEVNEWVESMSGHWRIMICRCKD